MDVRTRSLFIVVILAVIGVVIGAVLLADALSAKYPLNGEQSDHLNG
jgi:hypothetical protein